MSKVNSNHTTYLPLKYITSHPPISTKPTSRLLQILSWDRHTNVAGLNRYWDPNLSSRANRISNDNIYNSTMTFFFRFVNKRVIYRLGIISLAHAGACD